MRNIHKRNLKRTRRYRSIPCYIALCNCLIATAVAVPGIINKSVGWASGSVIYAIISLIFMLGSLGYLAPYYVLKSKANHTSLKITSTIVPVKEKYAPPRTGKSSSMYLEAQFIQPLLEFQLKYDYWYYKNHIEKWTKENNQERILKWEVIKASYEYWASHDYAWCVMSSLPCTHQGKQVLQLKKGHLLQEIWAPRYTLWLVDEAGKFLPQQKFEDKITELVDTYREIGHFKFWCIYCEQRQDNIQCDIRAMTALTQCMQGQKNYCQPHFLLKIYKKLQKKAILPKNANNKNLAKKIEKLKQYIDSIGFRVWHSTIWQSNGMTMQDSKMTLYWTQDLDFEYDNECMFVAYKANIETLQDNVAWDSTLLTKEEAKEFFAPYKKPEKQVKPVDKLAELKKVIPNLIVDAELPTDTNIFKLCEEIAKSDLVKKWKKLSTIINHYDDILKGKYRSKTPEEIKALAIAKNKAKAEAKEDVAQAEEPSQEEDDGEVHCFD